MGGGFWTFEQNLAVGSYKNALFYNIHSTDLREDDTLIFSVYKPLNLNTKHFNATLFDHHSLFGKNVDGKKNFFFLISTDGIPPHPSFAKI